MNRVIAWFVGNPVAANLLMIVMVVGGVFAAPNIPQKIFPDIDVNIVEVVVPYRGAAPEEVEQGVCIRVEEEIESVAGIETIYTTASEGRCRIATELFYDADADSVTAEIKNRVDGITTFPEEADKPIVSKFVIKRAVVDIALSGDVPEDTLKKLAYKVRDEIAALDEITQVEVRYDRRYEIAIEVSEESLRRFGLSFDQVVAAVQRSSLDLPGGRIKAAGGEILLRSIGQAYRGIEFEEIVVVTRSDGTRVTLGEIATVLDGFEDDEVSAQFDGQPAVMVRVRRVGEEDVIDISDATKAYVAQAKHRMPEGVELTIWQDSSTQLRGRLNTLYRNGRTGLLLVFIVLALFLRFRLAVWVAAGVPIAVLGALTLMPPLGISINQVTLFAFILVLGILVDDAIVVGENIYTHERRLGDRKRASVSGAQEVAVPVIFGVLTSVAAFAPLLVIPGRMGQVFFFMGLTLVCCLIFSLIESQLVLPSHLSHGHSKVGSRGSASAQGRVQRFWYSLQDRFSNGLERFTEDRYKPFLERALEWRYLSVATSVAMLMLAVGIAASGRVNFSFFPPVEAEYVAAQLTMPRGTPQEVTIQAVEHLESSADALLRRLDPQYASEGGSLVEHRLISLGKQGFHPADRRGNQDTGGHVAEVVLELIPSEARPISTREIAQHWRELTGEIPGATELVFATDLFSAGAPIDLQLRGPESVPLGEVAQLVKSRLAEYPGVIDIADTYRSGKREIKLELLPEAEPLGITMQDLARQVRQAFYGEEAQRIQRGRDDVRVMVRYPDAQRRSLSDLENLRIRSADGAEVPFSTVARATFGRGFADIRRTDRQRVVNVSADVDLATTTANEVMTAFRKDSLNGILADYPDLTLRLEGEQRDQQKAFSGLVGAFPGAMIAIYALLAIPLRSYLQPLLIMSVIPFGIVGALLGHMLMGRALSFPSVMGIVALSGVVVNASLVLVDYVNRRRADGAKLSQAVVEAGTARFRPIVLTAVTTFAGLTPLMLERSLQAQILIPMAVSMAFGVLFATVITLVLVPCGTVIVEDLKNLARRGSPRRAHTTRPRPIDQDRAA